MDWLNTQLKQFNNPTSTKRKMENMTTLPLRNSVNRVLRLAPALVVVVALTISARLSAQDQHGYTFIEFNTPGFQDTFPQDINPRGTIVGYARSAINIGPAFVRAPNGAITT